MDNATKILLKELHDEINTIHDKIDALTERIDYVQHVSDQMKKETSYLVHKLAEQDQKIFYIEEDIAELKSSK